MGAPTAIFMTPFSIVLDIIKGALQIYGEKKIRRCTKKCEVYVNISGDITIMNFKNTLKLTIPR